MRPPTLATLATLAVLAATAGCASTAATRSADANGYGSGATLMIHAQLRAGTSGEEGSAMSKDAITKPGVVFTNYTPADGVIVGVKEKADAALVEQLLRAKPSVIAVTEGPAPTAPPSTESGKP